MTETRREKAKYKKRYTVGFRIATSRTQRKRACDVLILLNYFHTRIIVSQLPKQETKGKDCEQTYDGIQY